MPVQSLGGEDLLEEEMATHSSILAWKIPWTEEPGKLQSMGSQSQTQISMHAYTHTFIHQTGNRMLIIFIFGWWNYRPLKYVFFYAFLNFLCSRGKNMLLQSKTNHHLLKNNKTLSENKLHPSIYMQPTLMITIKSVSG